MTLSPSRSIHTPQHRPLTVVAAVALTALALTGCSAAGSAETDETASEESFTYTWQRNTATEEGAEPVFEETTVEVPADPQRIVVFEAAALDTIGALGGEVTGAPLDFVPDYLQKYLAKDAFNAGSLFEADLIEIEAQQPDLIVIGGRSSAMYDDLSEIAPTIDLGITGGYLETLERNVTFLGRVLDAEDEADAALSELQAGIDDAREATANAGNGLAIMVSGGQLSAMAPVSGEANSPNVRGGLVYDVFGVEPVLDDIRSATHGEPISFEFLLENDPDTLWVVDRDAATGEAEAGAAAQVLDNEIVAQTSAARNDRIAYLDPTVWYMVYGGIDTTQLMIDDVLKAVR